MNQIVGVFIIAIALAGCTAPRGPLVVSDPDPSVKIPAIELAVKKHDRSVIPQLVKDLESDDPAIRFYSIDGLRKLTGEDFGYEFFDDDAARASAVKRWRRWLNEPVAASNPTTKQ